MKIFKTLVAKTSTGLNKYWHITVEERDGKGYYFTESWQDLANGSESVHKISDPTEVAPKNIGRSNATTSLEQAYLEAESKVKKQHDKGYWVQGEPEPTKLPLPMLAHSFNKRGHNITYPAFVQPKLDGVRCLFDGKKAWSRMGKVFIDEVIAHLKCDMPEGVILDGELMLPKEKYTFQETISAIKKFDPVLSPLLKLYVYDIVNGDDFSDRRVDYEYLVNDFGSDGIVEVVTKIIGNPESGDNDDGEPLTSAVIARRKVDNLAQLKQCHGEYVEDGYEGIIIRNTNGKYSIGNRSADLQKYKLFFDDEFKIADVETGVGKFEGAGILICETADGQRFKATPKGTMEYRRSIWTDRTNIIGKEATVRYQELTDAGIPRFPIAIGLRDYE